MRDGTTHDDEAAERRSGAAPALVGIGDPGPGCDWGAFTAARDRFFAALQAEHDARGGARTDGEEAPDLHPG